MPNNIRKCPICDNGNIYFFIEKNSYTFSKCRDCDLVFIDPELPAYFLEPLYNKQGGPDQGLRYPYDKVNQRQSAP